MINKFKNGLLVLGSVSAIGVTYLCGYSKGKSDGLSFSKKEIEKILDGVQDTNILMEKKA